MFFWSCLNIIKKIYLFVMSGMCFCCSGPDVRWRLYSCLRKVWIARRWGFWTPFLNKLNIMSEDKRMNKFLPVIIRIWQLVVKFGRELRESSLFIEEESSQTLVSEKDAGIWDRIGTGLARNFEALTFRLVELLRDGMDFYGDPIQEVENWCCCKKAKRAFQEHQKHDQKIRKSLKTKENQTWK